MWVDFCKKSEKLDTPAPLTSFYGRASPPTITNTTREKFRKSKEKWLIALWVPDAQGRPRYMSGQGLGGWYAASQLGGKRTVKKAVQLRTLWGDQSKAKLHTPSFREGCLRKKRKCFVIPSRSFAKQSPTIFVHLTQTVLFVRIAVIEEICLQSSHKALSIQMRPFRLVASTAESESSVLLKSVCSSRVRDPDAGVRMSVLLLPALHDRSYLTIQPACLFAEKKQTASTQ